MDNIVLSLKLISLYCLTLTVLRHTESPLSKVSSAGPAPRTLTPLHLSPPPLATLRAGVISLGARGPGAPGGPGAVHRAGSYSAGHHPQHRLLTQGRALIWEQQLEPSAAAGGAGRGREAAVRERGGGGGGRVGGRGAAGVNSRNQLSVVIPYWGWRNEALNFPLLPAIFFLLGDVECQTKLCVPQTVCRCKYFLFLVIIKNIFYLIEGLVIRLGQVFGLWHMF